MIWFGFRGRTMRTVRAPMEDSVEPKKPRFWRTAAGNIELFLGVYFVTFGSLAALFFKSHSHPLRALIAAVAALFGFLLILRARKLLDWNRWFFWFVVIALISIPVVWFAPALLRLR